MAENAAQKKPGFIARAKRFAKDVSGEMKKIVWPGKQTVRDNTVIVIVVVIISSIFVGCLDIITTQLVKFLTSLL